MPTISGDMPNFWKELAADIKPPAFPGNALARPERPPLAEAAEAPEEKVEGLLTACRIEPCVENIRF